LDQIVSLGLPFRKSMVMARLQLNKPTATGNGAPATATKAGQMMSLLGAAHNLILTMQAKHGSYASLWTIELVLPLEPDKVAIPTIIPNFTFTSRNLEDLLLDAHLSIADIFKVRN